jgi:hypothetical protein
MRSQLDKVGTHVEQTYLAAFISDHPLSINQTNPSDDHVEALLSSANVGQNPKMRITTAAHQHSLISRVRAIVKEGHFVPLMCQVDQRRVTVDTLDNIPHQV